MTSDTTSLPPERWAEASALLDEALALEDAERDAWLMHLSTKDPALGEILRRLLKARASATSPDILASGLPSQLLAEALGGPGASLKPGELVGPYRLVRALGAGGMATVWLAEQTAAVIRQVALKIPHSGLETQGSVASRFQRERDLLAALEHEHIARLYDAGVTPEGVLFLAMEFIDGVPITDYCDARRLSIAARLALFDQVLAAVGLAHTRLVIHRDLKPSNILVTGAGQVKLLDFGIANLLSDQPAPASGRGPEALTPDTASPEQLAGRPLSTASDVYSLGVILYELLTGHKPYVLDRSGGSLHSALMATRIAAPSAVPAAESIAAARATTPSGLRRSLRGSLDAIVGKSLERDTAKRYPNVESLAADLTHHARREPVLAVGSSVGYQLRCFVSRRRWPLGVAAALIAVMLTGVVATLWQARTAREEAARATAVRDFLVRVFKASDPRIASDQPRGQITARELLDSGAAQIDGEFKSQPGLQLEMLALLSTLYRELDERDRYLALQDRRLALARKYPGRFTGDEVEVLLNLAGDDDRAGGRAAARSRLANADALLKRAGLDDSLLRARWWLAQGQSLDANDIAARMTAYTKALQLFDRYGSHDPGRVTTLSEIGLTAYDVGDSETAIRRWREALAADVTTVDRDDAETQTILGNLMNAYLNMGRYDEAEIAGRQAADMARRTYGEHNSDYWVPAAQYAKLLHLGGRENEARAQFETLRASMPFPPQANDGWEAFAIYAECLIAEGDAERGRSIAEAAERNFLVRPEAPNSVRRVRLRLGEAYEQLGRIDDARRTLKAAYDEYVKTELPERQTRMAATERWARFLVSQGDAEAARTLFTEVLAQDHERHLAHSALARGGLARVALAEKDIASALRESQTALADWSAVRGFRDVRMGAYLKRVEARVLLASGDAARARTFAQEALTESLRFDVPGATSVSEARELLAKSVSAQSPALPH
jgi:serine/threonine-protein kinase